MWFVGPQPIVPSLYGLVVCLFLFTSLALVATFIRLYTRAAMIQRLGWDDWFMTSTMLFSLFFFVSVFYRTYDSLRLPFFFTRCKGSLPGANTAAGMNACLRAHVEIKYGLGTKSPDTIVPFLAVSLCAPLFFFPPCKRYKKNQNEC